MSQLMPPGWTWHTDPQVRSLCRLRALQSAALLGQLNTRRSGSPGLPCRPSLHLATLLTDETHHFPSSFFAFLTGSRVLPPHAVWDDTVEPAAASTHPGSACTPTGAGSDAARGRSRRRSACAGWTGKRWTAVCSERALYTSQADGV
jgi:hypothetical protein